MGKYAQLKHNVSRRNEIFNSKNIYKTKIGKNALKIP